MLKLVIEQTEGTVKKEVETLYFKKKWMAKLYRVFILASFRKRFKKQGIELDAWISDLELKDYLYLSNGK